MYRENSPAEFFTLMAQKNHMNSSCRHKNPLSLLSNARRHSSASLNDLRDSSDCFYSKATCSDIDREISVSSSSDSSSDVELDSNKNKLSSSYQTGKENTQNPQEGWAAMVDCSRVEKSLQRKASILLERELMLEKAVVHHKACLVELSDQISQLGEGYVAVRRKRSGTTRKRVEIPGAPISPIRDRNVFMGEGRLSLDELDARFST